MSSLSKACLLFCHTLKGMYFSSQKLYKLLGHSKIKQVNWDAHNSFVCTRRLERQRKSAIQECWIDSSETLPLTYQVMLARPPTFLWVTKYSSRPDTTITISMSLYIISTGYSFIKDTRKMMLPLYGSNQIKILSI